MTQKDVKLNLTITAKDEAKAVVESLARTMSETFDGLGAKLVESMGLSKITESFDALKASANTNMNGVKTAAEEPKSAFDTLAETVFKTRGELEKDFEAIKASFGNASLEAVKASELTVAQLAKIVTAADESSPKIEAFKNKFQESFDAISQTSFKTRDALETDFDRIKTAFDNESLAAVKASDLTTSALAKIVGSADETEISVVNTMNKMDEGITLATTHVGQSLDYMNLQMSGQMIEQLGSKITGFFGGAAGAAVEFDQSVVNTAASLNSNLPAGIRLATGQVTALRDASLEMGKSGFFSANQIAESMNVLARQGIDYNTIMGGASQTVHDVAAANQADVASTANVVSDIIHEMGDSLGKEATKSAAGQKIMTSAMSDTEKQSAILKLSMGNVGDAMTGSLHHARISMEDFLNTMKYVGPQASAVGLGIGDVSASIALLGEHGIRGSQAGTTLRRELTNLIPQSAAAADMMDKLGLVTEKGGNVFFDATGHMKSMNDVQAILHKTLGGLNPEMQEMAVKTIFGQYALSGMTAIVNTAPSKFNELTDAMHKTGITQQLMADKSEGWGMQVQKLKAHWETIRKEIGELLKPAIEGIMGVITQLMAIWDGLSEPVKKAITTFGAVTGVVLLVGGAFIASLAGIGMFVGAIGAGAATLAAIAAPALVVIGAIAAVGLAGYGLYEAWKNDWGGIQEKTAAVLTWIQTQIKAAMDYIMPVISGAVKMITDWWSTIGPSFGKAVKNIYDFIVWLEPIWSGAWSVIVTVLKTTFDVVMGIIRGGIEVVTGIISFFIDLFAGNWSKLWGDVERILRGAFDILKSIFSGSIELITGLLNDLWKTIVAIFGGIAKSIADWGVNLLKTVGTFFTDLGKDALSWGANVIDMFVQGIMGAVHKVTDAVKNVANTVKSFLGFHSPTEQGPASDSDQWMPNMMSMLHTGIVDHTPKIEAAVGHVALGLQTAFAGNTVNNVAKFPTVAPANNGRPTNVFYINVDATTAKNGQQIAEKIAAAFRTQMPMVSA